MKKLTREEICAFRCPRWDELPNIPLYMDQVTLLLEDAIGIFSDEKERVITKTMINNYVKQKIISAPEKKKYGKKHIAMLIVLSILKRILSMSEIDGVLLAVIEDHGLEEAYNLFCERLENNLRNAFAPGDLPMIEAVPHGASADTLLSAAIAALIGKLVVQSRIAEKTGGDA